LFQAPSAFLDLCIRHARDGSTSKTKRQELNVVILGIVGAVVGGWLFNTFGHMGVTGVNLYSILVAVVGAVIVLFIYHAVSRISAPHIGSW